MYCSIKLKAAYQSSNKTYTSYATVNTSTRLSLGETCIFTSDARETRSLGVYFATKGPTMTGIKSGKFAGKLIVSNAQEKSWRPQI